MSGDGARSNVIILCERIKERVSDQEGEIDEADAGEFIADMIDMLMRLSSGHDRPLLIYLLAMARIEALEMAESGQGKEGE